MTDLQDLIDDGTSSSPASVDVDDLKRQLSNQNQQQILQWSPQQRQLKNAQNHLYGQSIVQQKSKEAFKRKVEETFQAWPDECMELDGGDYDSMSNALLDALRFVEEKHYKTEDYTWFVHDEVMYDIENLCKFHSRLSSGNRSITQSNDLQIHGVPLKAFPTVPEGWALLARKDKFKESGVYAPARPHAMVLIRELNGGCREQIEMNIGGSLNIRVMNA